MTAPRRLALLLVASSGLFAQGCTTSICTLIGGHDGFYVRVMVTGGRLPPGDYTFVARVGDVEITADGTILPEGSHRHGSSEGSVEDKHLILDGSVSANAGAIWVWFREGRGPSMVELGIRHEGVTLGEQSYAPKYSTVYPNGEDCSPELQQATDSLVIAAP
jgi:hypothetical protein